MDDVNESLEHQRRHLRAPRTSKLPNSLGKSLNTPIPSQHIHTHTHTHTHTHARTHSHKGTQPAFWDLPENHSHPKSRLHHVLQLLRAATPLGQHQRTYSNPVCVSSANLLLSWFLLIYSLLTPADVTLLKYKSR